MENGKLDRGVVKYLHYIANNSVLINKINYFYKYLLFNYLHNM